MIAEAPVLGGFGRELDELLLLRDQRQAVLAEPLELLALAGDRDLRAHDGDAAG